jgi:fumarate reductase flavoprotein subunit
MEFDVVAIGGGFAGLVAANRCAELGLRAAVIERETAERYLCNSRYTTGIAHILFQDMRLPAEKLSQVIERETAGCARPELMQALAAHSKRAVDWLNKEGGRFIEINAPTGRSIILAPPRRFKEGLDWEGRGGDVLLRRLADNLARRGGSLLRGVAAEQLSMQDGRCVGIGTTRDGTPTRFDARAVIVADGGFGSSLEMIRRYITPRADRLLIRGSGSATGDGLRMAEAAGAHLTGFGAFYGHPVHREALTHNKANLWPFPFIDALAQAGIVVGADGKRFTDESRGGIAIANAMAQLEDPLSATAVFDEKIWTTVGREGPVNGNPMIVSAGASLHKANDAAALAAKAGVDAAGLQEAVTGRPDFKPPFYAVPLCCGITATMGGIAIDAQCRALRADGSPIPGLYAAGSTVAGIEGGPKVAYVGGLSKAFIFGLLSAEAIAAALR